MAGCCCCPAGLRVPLGEPRWPDEGPAPDTTAACAPPAHSRCSAACTHPPHSHPPTATSPACPPPTPERALGLAVPHPLWHRAGLPVPLLVLWLRAAVAPPARLPRRPHSRCRAQDPALRRHCHPGKGAAGARGAGVSRGGALCLCHRHTESTTIFSSEPRASHEVAGIVRACVTRGSPGSHGCASRHAGTHARALAAGSWLTETSGRLCAHRARVPATLPSRRTPHTARHLPPTARAPSSTCWARAPRCWACRPPSACCWPRR